MTTFLPTLVSACKVMTYVQIVTIRLSYKLQWPEQRMIVNESAAWGKEGEINISPENIEVGYHYFTLRISRSEIKKQIS